MTISSSIHSLANDMILFFTNKDAIVCAHPAVFVSSAGHLSCLHGVAVVNCAASKH